MWGDDPLRPFSRCLPAPRHLTSAVALGLPCLAGRVSNVAHIRGGGGLLVSGTFTSAEYRVRALRCNQHVMGATAPAAFCASVLASRVAVGYGTCKFFVADFDMAVAAARGYRLSIRRPDSPKTKIISRGRHVS